jgi:lipid II:glycine glycyltransferase (peptidoglycan interpeptide bridge formation enzyme)
VNRSLEFELGLDRPAEEIMAGMDRYHRKNVRRAERAGVSVVFDTSLDALLLLRELQVSSSTRGEEKGNPFGVRDPEYFHRAYELVYAPGWGEVAFARVGEKTVAGLAYLVAGNRAITVRSGATPLGYEANAMYILQHEVLIRLGKKGVHQINLGAVPLGATEPQHPQHGLYDFKKGFGGTPRPRTRITLPVPRRPDGGSSGG